MAKNVSLASMDQKLAMAKRCSHGTFPLIACTLTKKLIFLLFDDFFLFFFKMIVNAEGVIAGAKAAVVASVATAIPTFAIGKMLPWARTYLNPTAKALIVSTAAGMAYFVVADKTILKTARQNSFKQA
uniref:Early nodulin n=1 Tax=Solanum tuberosum TaxID=4113 RepID=M1BMW7_SOLTU